MNNQQQGKPQDPFIEKHLAIIKQKTKDALIDHHIGKMWGSLSSASIKYFLETGKVNGGFREHLLNLMDAWKKYKLDETPTEEQKEEAVSVWKSVEKHTLPLETPILLLHQYGVEAIQFHNAAWRYWYSSQTVDVHVLQTAKAFMVATDRNISPVSSAPPISHKEDEQEELTKKFYKNKNK